MPHSRTPAALLALAFLGAAGCTVSNLEGPQLRDVPEGFGYDETASSNRRVLPDRDIRTRTGYYFRSDGGNASIILTELEGTTERDEAERARDAQAESWQRTGATVTELENHAVDERSSWGWFEQRGPRGRRFALVVPYDDVTFTVDFYSSVGGDQDEAFLRRHALTFGRNPSAEHDQTARFWLGLLIVAAFAVAWWFRRQRQYRRRLRR